MASAKSRRGSAVRGMREVQKRMGSGTLSGELVRDQLYAAYQHEHMDLAHPHGGQAKYQESPLMAHYESYLRTLARQIGRDFDAVKGMDDAISAFEADVVPLVPVDLHVLIRSGHRRVLDRGRVVRDHPPEAPRLSDDELGQTHSDRALTDDERGERQARVDRGEGRDSDIRELERGRVDPVRGERVSRGDYRFVRSRDGERRGRREGERRRGEGER